MRCLCTMTMSSILRRPLRVNARFRALSVLLIVAGPLARSVQNAPGHLRRQCHCQVLASTEHGVCDTCAQVYTQKQPSLGTAAVAVRFKQCWATQLQSSRQSKQQDAQDVFDVPHNAHTSAIRRFYALVLGLQPVAVCFAPKSSRVWTWHDCPCRALLYQLCSYTEPERKSNRLNRVSPC